MNRRLRTYLCRLCSLELSGSEDWVAHTGRDHLAELRVLYTESQKGRAAGAEELGVSENLFKGLLKATGLGKERSQWVRAGWSQLGQEEKAARISSAVAAKGYYRSFEAALEALSNGEVLLDSALSRRAYRAWRKERLEEWCDLCGGQGSGWKHDFCVDHSHANGIIRGLLCLHCNSLLGWFENHSEAIELYLSRPLSEVIYTKSLGRELRVSSAEGQACDLCLVPLDMVDKKPVLDHCHAAGLVRGVLCTGCNVRLGQIAQRPMKSYISLGLSKEEDL